MSLDPLRQSQFHPDAVINASGDTTNHTSAPTGVGNTASTLAAEGSSDGCCSLIGKRFLSFKERLGELCLRIKEWVKSWFISPRPQTNPTPGNTSHSDLQPNPPVNDPLPNNPPQPNPLVNDPLPNNPPQPNPLVNDPLPNNPPEPNPPVNEPLPNNPPQPNPPVNDPLPNNPPEPNPPVNDPLPNNPPEPNPPVNDPMPNNPPQLNPPVNDPLPNPPANNLWPTPELILQTYGNEVKVYLTFVTGIFQNLAGLEYLDRNALAISDEVQAHFVAVYDCFPPMVQAYIQNRMEELKRAANPEVALVPNWAYRMIRNQLQYDNEAVPIADRRESAILDSNYFFRRAIDDLYAQLGGPPLQNLPSTLGVLRIAINCFKFILFVRPPDLAEAITRDEARPLIIGIFRGLSPGIQAQIEEKMLQLVEVENPGVRGIPLWTGHVIWGVLGGLNDLNSILLVQRHMNIFAADSIFLRAIVELMNEAPVPQPAQV